MHTRALGAAITLFVVASTARAQDSTADPDLLRVAIFDFPPFHTLSPTGPPSGFAVDVMEAVAQRAGVRVRYVLEASAASALRALSDGDVDVVPNIGIIPSRDEEADFSHPVYVSRVRIFVRAGTSGIGGPADLTGRRVAVVAGNVGVDIATPMRGVADTTYATSEAALLALIAGRADAMIYPEAMMWTLVTDLGLRDLVETTGPPVREVERALAVREGNVALLARLDPAIDALVADDEYAQIVRRWFADPPPFWTVRRVLTWAGVLLLVLAAGHSLRVRQLNRRLVRSADQLRALAAHLNTAREDEQRTLARELHDEIGQAMVALKMDLTLLREHDLGRDSLDARYDDMVALADSAIGVGHRICTRLRPDILDQLGLEAAVEWFADDFQQRTGIACTVEGSGADHSIDSDVSTAFFRILQEALANVLRHAEAHAVVIRLQLAGDLLTMEVEDDGRGVSPHDLERPDALGVLGMRERAAALGGSVSIGRGAESGTVVRVDIPRTARPLANA